MLFLSTYAVLNLLCSHSLGPDAALTMWSLAFFQPSSCCEHRSARPFQVSIWSEPGSLLSEPTRRATRWITGTKFQCEERDSNHRFDKTIFGLHSSNLRASAFRHLHAAPRHISADILPRFPLRDASGIINDSHMGAGSESLIATTPKLH